MVTGLACLATAVATLFAQATFVRWTRGRAPYEAAWSIALTMFALASAALATGSATGWDAGTFRAFYLLGAILNVAWLALGTLYLLAGPRAGRAARWGLVAFSGLATGVMLVCPMSPFGPDTIPVGHEVLGSLPRILAAIGSGLGAAVVFGGALWSAVRLARGEGTTRVVAANWLIAGGTLVLSSGGLVQGTVGEDEAFALTLAVGIVVIYAGFLVAGPGAGQRSSRRKTFPATVRGSSTTSSTTWGHL